IKHFEAHFATQRMIEVGKTFQLRLEPCGCGQSSLIQPIEIGPDHDAWARLVEQVRHTVWHKPEQRAEFVAIPQKKHCGRVCMRLMANVIDHRKTISMRGR